MEPHGDPGAHAPPPSLWPLGFAVGVVCVLIGLVLGSWSAVAVGAVLTLVFAFLWLRDLATGAAAVPVETDAGPGGPETATDAPAIPAHIGGPALPEMDEDEIRRFPRSRFLEASTLGLGALIGGVVTVPVAVMAGVDPFRRGGDDEVDLGPIEDFPEGSFVIATFLTDPGLGEVSRRTAFVRNNGLTENGQPSFTIMSNRCVHLGCPVQANGLLLEGERKKVDAESGATVETVPTTGVGSFGCPCHGGQYDTEGNPTAGPPVRALDRYEFAIRDGRLMLLKTFSVGKVVVENEEDPDPRTARIYKYEVADPGVHVDGPSAWLYPVEPPR